MQQDQHLPCHYIFMIIEEKAILLQIDESDKENVLIVFLIRGKGFVRGIGFAYKVRQAFDI